MSRVRSVIGSGAAALAMGACVGSSPPGPTGPASLSPLPKLVVVSNPRLELTEVFPPRAPSADGNEGPTLVAKVRPRPNGDGVIELFDAPYSVNFNICRSSDPEQDALRFTHDFEGDGKVDDSGDNGGVCRRAYEYAVGPGETRTFHPRSCVTDTDADGRPLHEDLCRTYTVVVRAPASSSAPAPAPAPTTKPGCELDDYTATADGDTLTCTCEVSGEVLPFYLGPAPSYAGKCFATGADEARWAFGGACSCSVAP